LTRSHLIPSSDTSLPPRGALRSSRAFSFPVVPKDLSQSHRLRIHAQRAGRKHPTSTTAGDEFAFGEGPGPVITEEDDSAFGQVTVPADTLYEKSKAYIGWETEAFAPLSSEKSAYDTGGIYSAHLPRFDTHILESRYKRRFRHKKPLHRAATHREGPSFCDSAYADNNSRTGEEEFIGLGIRIESGLIASNATTMDGNLLNPRLAGTRARQIQDAKNMQTAVAERLTKKGLNVPPYEFLELTGKGSYGRVYKR
jgi:hypothetical protein